MENTTPSQIKTKKIKLDFKDSKYATGRRKKSIAKVWVKKGSGVIHVNGLKMSDYFKRPVHQIIVTSPLEITEVAYDLSGDEVTIVWSSRSGRTYAIDYSEDLMDWSEIDDGIAADGDSTEFSDILPHWTMMRFWRVREMDP